MDKSLELMVRMGTLRPETLLGLKKLNELNLNRLQKHGENGLIVISTNRSSVQSDNPNCDLLPEYAEYLKKNNLKDSEEVQEKWLDARNKAADKSLHDELVSGDYSFTPVFGGYHGGDGVIDEFEPSFIVYNYSKKGEPGDFSNLLELAKKWCAEYKQAAVYVQAPGQAPVYIDKDGNQVNRSSTKDTKYNRDNEAFYTTTKRDKTDPQRFTASVIYESMYRKVYERTEKMKRVQEGEYIL